MSGLILFNKPYGVLCQFSGDGATLASYIDQPGYYAAGRLDKDSEGLVLLTNDGKLQARIANPRFKMEKEYWVQVEGDITPEAIHNLGRGVTLKDGLTKPATVKCISTPLPERIPAIRFRASIPTSWISMTIKEGKNRQVRRMTAAVGFPTLRLYRHRIGDWNVTDLNAGESRKTNINLG